MASMYSNLGSDPADTQVRLHGPAERIRANITRRRPALLEARPRAVDATACAIAAMWSAAHGRMSSLGAHSERYTQMALSGDRALHMDDVASWLHGDRQAQAVALAGLQALLASVGWEARPVPFGLAALPETMAQIAASAGRFLADFTRMSADGQIDAHEAAELAPDAESLHVSSGVAQVGLLRLAGGGR